MRAIFVNYSHPDTPHVSGVRVPRFAEAMARRGHQIILITNTLSNDDLAKLPEQVVEELRYHKWNSPYHLACKPISNLWLDRVRNDRLPMPLRKAMVAWYLWRKEGVFNDWVEGSRRYWDILVEFFRPEVIWGSFGHVDVLSIARTLAMRAGIHWVMDIKDTWVECIPRPLQRVLTRRFMDAAALTVNSRFQAERSAHWFGKCAEIVYSGVPSNLFDDVWPTEPKAEFRIMLVGSTYGEERLKPFIQAIQTWLARRLPDERALITFAYAGGDSELVKRLSSQMADLCHIKVHGYLKFSEMIKICQSSAVNCYMWLPTTFHHKLVELMFCRRPVMTFPGEYAEAVEIAQQVGGELYVCKDIISVCNVLEGLWENRFNGRRPGDLKALQAFTWDAQATTLEQTLRKVIAGAF